MSLSRLCTALRHAALATLMLASTPALAADTYPSATIRLVVPYPPGGTTDIVGRLVAEQMQARLGQPVVVENKAGAGGNIGAATVAKAPADGYTLLLTASNVLAINPSLYSGLPFDADKDFAAVVNVVKVNNVILVNPQNRYGINTLADLVDTAKKHPDTLNFGSTGNASLTHLIGSVLSKTADIKVMHIPYKGSAPMLHANLAREVDFGIDNLPGPLAQIQAGSLKALAMTGTERHPLLPDVPTVAESGYPGFNLTSWFGVMAPAGVDTRIIEKLNGAINEALSDPEVKARLLSMGMQPDGGSSADFAAMIRAERARWEQIVRESGATLN